jgi:hypothetical protein
MGNHLPNPPVASNYQVPGAIIDPALAAQPDEQRKALRTVTKKASRGSKAQDPKKSKSATTKTATRKRAPVHTNGTVERETTKATENDPPEAGGRTRKRKLNPDSEEFVQMKKGRRA